MIRITIIKDYLPFMLSVTRNSRRDRIRLFDQAMHELNKITCRNKYYKPSKRVIGVES